MSDLLSSRRSIIEPLEARIAPAAVINATWKTATLGAPIELFAGEGLSTAGPDAGTYLLYVEKGSALIFITDLNDDGEVNFNEITGIAAGDGLALTSFIDIHGDIATNLQQISATISGQATTKLVLTDSDNNRTNDLRELGDGKILANTSIESVTLRSLTLADIDDQNADGVIDDRDLALRKAYTTYSIFGHIYAGRGFGVTGGGLLIDTTNGTGLPDNFGFPVQPSVGSIRVGTAVSGEYFTYGVSGTKAAAGDPSRYDDYNGIFVPFNPPAGQTGGDIIGVRAADAGMIFNLDGLYAGNGGFAARGGNIVDVTINIDDTGGYDIVAGNGGRGSAGGPGGSILNFTDLGSQTSKVLIRSGSGGVSTSGVGGNAGNLVIGTFNVFGNIEIALGSGGNGFTAGGNGAGLTKGLFNQPATVAFVPGNVVGTMHQPLVYGGLLGNTYSPIIGTHQGIDFNGDGFGDVVFTSKRDSQLVVQFGNGFGGVDTEVLADGTVALIRLYLSGARNAEALNVGDFNGDGLPDIAVASRDDGSQAGIGVFLNKGYEDLNRDGVVTPEEDINGSGDADRDGFIDNDFFGFRTVRYSPLPQFAEPVQVSNLTSGDYDGDGKIEIAAIVTTYGTITLDGLSGITISLSNAGQYLVYMTPDEEFNNATGKLELTGQFYNDVGISTARRVPYIGIPFTGDADLANYNSVVVETTALLATGGNQSTHDVIFVGVRAETDFRRVAVYDYASRDPILGPPLTPRLPVVVGNYGFGRVDSNRDLGPDRIAQTDYTLRDFTVFDADADGDADVAVVSQSPALFLTGIVGTVTTTAAGQTVIGTMDSGDGLDNAGNFFGNKGRDLRTDALMTIRSADVDGNGAIDDLVILDSEGRLILVDYRSGIQPTDAPQGALTGTIPFISDIASRVQATANGPGAARLEDSGAEFFGDIFLPLVANTRAPSFVVSEFDTAITNRVNFAVAAPNAVSLSDFADNGEVRFRLAAGDGGDSFVGKGGAGGVVGSGSTLTRTTDPLTGLPFTALTGTIQINLSGNARITAGDGGDGFTTGGKGGSISGVVLRPPTFNLNAGVTALLVAGDGGRGVSGVGGAGGDLTQNSIEAQLGLATFLGGDGGSGRTGGAGGFVLGNGSSIFDSASASVSVIAGFGGAGVKAGGHGGRIANFHPIIEGSSLQYIAGAGGDAVAGLGGAGGSVTDSSPRVNDFIQSEIIIRGGDGGDGLSGGAGGLVSTFVVRPAAISAQPTILSIVAGSGGDGISGSGGLGGGVSKITVPTTGGLGVTTRFRYSRILGGDGGDSSGGRGGNGGGVADVTETGASSGAFAIVGGAGGHGLYSGGHGGNVTRTDIFLGAGTSSKALIIAGEGGHAFAFVPNLKLLPNNVPTDTAANQVQNAFGGRIGIGGNGGSIIGFTQRGSIGSHVDLISGNGGDTRNYGSLNDTKVYVGKAGSISGVKLSGDVGNLQVDDPNTLGFNENVPIKSYNNVIAANGAVQTVADWVNANIRLARAPATGGILTDAQGNVGIIVGTSGFNKAVVTDPTGAPNKYVKLPANGTVNGNLIDIEARNILSAVAGSVDQIARIQIAQNIRVLGGVIGADKPLPGTGAPVNAPVFGTSDYFDKFGVLTADGKLVLDGRLSDGALVARNVLGANGKPIILPGRVFNPT